MKNAVDFKFYDITAEDHSAHKDPRPLESLESVINPGFDNEGTMLSHPLPPHIPRLTQSDRQIFESCAISGSKILWPHRNNSGIAQHLSVQYIMNKAKCSANEATQIADSSVTLEATKEMVDKFCRWAKARGTDKLLEYLWPLVIGVTEAETPLNEHEPWEDNPVEAGRPLWGSYINNIRGNHGICEDIPIETIEPYKPEPGLANIVGSEIIWPRSKLDFLPDLDDEELEATEQEPPESNLAPSTINYHILENFSLDEEEPWIDNQPEWFIQKLSSIRSCKTLKALASLGKAIHSKNGFSRDQAGVFWTEYNSHKKSLIPRHYSLTCRSLLTKIASSDGCSGAVGVWLHKVQAEEIKVTPMPTEFEWGVIWGEYQNKKALLINKSA